MSARNVPSFAFRMGRAHPLLTFRLDAAPTEDEVFYLQSQNGNIRSPDSDETEYAVLRDDVPASFAWASEALGSSRVSDLRLTRPRR